MKTHAQIRRPLIVLYQFAGLIALIASIANMLGYREADWQLNMIVGLAWLIFATLEEGEARLRDANEYGVSADIHIWAEDKEKEQK
jgi:hypothetical protein